MTGHDDCQVAGFLGTDLDEWTAEVVARSFHQVYGSPFWLRRRARLPFDPLEITTFEDLVRFGPFPLDELRTLDPRDLVPLAVPRPLTGKVFESGGTTGLPKRLYYTTAMLEQREIWRRWNDQRAGFEENRVWLNALPTGPHIAGSVAEGQARAGADLVYGIDIDPRWAKHLVREGRRAEADEYTGHVLAQVLDVISTRHVDYLATTPALLLALCRRAGADLRKLAGARLTGTQITPAMYREFRETLGEDFIILRRYGNTMADPALGLGTQAEGAILPYRTAHPHTTLQVVDKDDWRTLVDYAENGQVRVTVLRRDLFMPNILERDEAIRWEDEGWPADSVANVRPLQSARPVPEGIY